jgi:hypothetical protein
MQAQVTRGDPVPIAKHPLQLSANECSAEPRAQTPEWESILDVVFQVAPARPVGHYTMAVAPISERPFGLHIAELSALFIIGMLGHPAAPESTGPNGQDDSATVRDAACLFEHTNYFPGRREPLESTWPTVPVED